MDLIKVVNAFSIKEKPLSVTPYGSGHINATYLVETEEGKRYILQRINNKIFPCVTELMNNIKGVLDHLASNAPEERRLSYVPTKSGASFTEEEDGFYRLYDFLENTTTYQVPDTPERFKASAEAFAAFQNILSDFDATSLFEVIPRFHDTRKRFEDFKKAVKEDKMGRAKSVKDEIDFVLERESYVDIFVDMLEGGVIPYRVTHNDTKINNVLIDNDTGKGIVIDLDTVMPGAIGYDFGDSIRFGCNPASEDERDLSKVNFRLDLFKTYAEGFLGTIKCITDKEKETLPLSAILMTLECGMRFLADHLEGDTYFRISRENHNLDRARTQFKLVADMEECFDEMCDIINNL